MAEKATKVKRGENGWKTIHTTKPPLEETKFSDNGQSVTLQRGGDTKKSLEIELWGQKPHFTFRGLWSGRDISIVTRHLTKAYHQHTRQIRREQISEYMSPKEVETHA